MSKRYCISCGVPYGSAHEKGCYKYLPRMFSEEEVEDIKRQAFIAGYNEAKQHLNANNVTKAYLRYKTGETRAARDAARRKQNDSVDR